MSKKYLFTSESVSEGHPDKVCDQISDAVLDEVMRQDPYGRVACETMVTTGLVIVAGEITFDGYLDIPNIVRGVIKKIGYTDAAYKFDYQSCGILNAIEQQSPDIAMGVVGTSKSKKKKGAIGAGDQGIMFGYACDETRELMPLPISLANKLVKKLADVRKKNIIPFLRPDSKSQVTVEYEGSKPVRIHTVVISTQHDPKLNGRELSQKKIREEVIKKVIMPVLPKKMVDKNLIIHVNPTGRFEIGGPHGDTGLTGRKIIVDSYGGVGSHGGGAFSGKDPSKVDRSATYMARYIAKNIVAANLAKRCSVQLAYAIGVADPVSVMVDTDGTGTVANDVLESAVRKVFPLTPEGIIKHLKLRNPIFELTAAYGHFGRNEPEFTWEKTDKANVLKRAVK